jgi:hypothetical protein
VIRGKIIACVYFRVVRGDTVYYKEVQEIRCFVVSVGQYVGEPGDRKE